MEFSIIGLPPPYTPMMEIIFLIFLGIRPFFET